MCNDRKDPGGNGKKRSEAIFGHIAKLREFGESVPEPTRIAREIEVSPAA
jgi:hypothetical protein